MELNYANQRVGTDVYPHEIVKRISEKTIEVRAMRVSTLPGHNYYGQQKYAYQSNSKAEIIRIRSCNRGWRCRDGRRFWVCAEPAFYQDPSF